VCRVHGSSISAVGWLYLKWIQAPARIVHAAAGRTGVAFADVRHGGDDAALDVLGALGAGMQMVWVNRTVARLTALLKRL